jgi:hypothetical protein
MSDEGRWPKKKRGRPPSEETVADRIFKAYQEKLRQAEQDESLSDFDMAAIVSRLWRQK